MCSRLLYEVVVASLLPLWCEMVRTPDSGVGIIIKGGKGKVILMFSFLQTCLLVKAEPDADALADP